MCYAGSVVSSFPHAKEPLESRVLLAVVTVDGSVRHQTMDGFGSSVRLFDDPHVFENFNAATGRGDRPHAGAAG